MYHRYHIRGTIKGPLHNTYTRILIINSARNTFLLYKLQAHRPRYMRGLIWKGSPLPVFLKTKFSDHLDFSILFGSANRVQAKNAIFQTLATMRAYEYYLRRKMLEKMPVTTAVLLNSFIFMDKYLDKY